MTEMETKTQPAPARPLISTLGLSLVCEGGETGPTVDIVFVHGLGGHPEKTWTHKGPASEPAPAQAKEKVTKRSSIRLPFRKKKTAAVGTDAGETASPSECFWPFDLLAKDQTSARIFTYGYDSSTSHFHRGPASKSNLLDHGAGLLQALVSARQDCRGRPLMFIAHSLGGLVVKQVCAALSNLPASSVR